MASWQNDYLQGTGCEMYTETLSPSFTGITFCQAAELVGQQFYLLLNLTTDSTLSDSALSS